MAVIYLGFEMTMSADRAKALIAAGNAHRAPETAAAKAPRTAERPRGKVRTATRKPKGGRRGAKP